MPLPPKGGSGFTGSLLELRHSALTRVFAVRRAPYSTARILSKNTLMTRTTYCSNLIRMRLNHPGRANLVGPIVGAVFSSRQVATINP
jgi:hypothetical protein